MSPMSPTHHPGLHSSMPSWLSSRHCCAATAARQHAHDTRTNYPSLARSRPCGHPPVLQQPTRSLRAIPWVGKELAR